MKETPKRVVIVGGGFAGLYAAKTLSNEGVEVTLIDRKNHHTFQPLLYQVALAVLSPAEIASPLRHILHKSRNVRTILGEVAGFDTAARRVKLTGGGKFDYDYLIVAAGARHAYFGHDEWQGEAPGLKTIEDAVEIRRRLLLAFEKAERAALLSGKQEPPTFAVIGGGPTGVELAGAIADLARLVLARDFKAIDTRKARVRLYEGSARVLGTFSEESSRSAKRQLQELGVEVFTESMVTAVEPGRIKVGEEWVASDVTLWATGVAASPLGKELGAKTDRAGRIAIEPDLSLPGHREVFLIGDMSALIDVNGTPVPGLAAAAIQQGKAAAHNILRDLRGEKRLPFKYEDRGTMATIGHHRAVAEFGNKRFSGVIAWLLWSLVHVFLLIGFRSRVTVMGQWIWAYLTRAGASPLITEYQRPESRVNPAHEETKVRAGMRNV
ncbi:MAG TPA: NAD(P)/FAD-dependent oxidoreductase [Candidatus Polarisedimenticolaceae bacterium]|nr:NAD(P)/FAD-dependent oxidoreductase [Candidatus Polarisedimenticolaceae bacterium]